MNKVILMGRLTRDPEVRYTQTNNTLVASFSLAVNRRFARQGEERQADFINIVAWNKTGEFCSKYFKKGQQVSIIGRIQTRSWDDENGQKRYATEVIAEEAYFAQIKAKEDKAAAKKADACKVEDAFKALNAARREYKDKIKEVTKVYNDGIVSLKTKYEDSCKLIKEDLANAENTYAGALKEFTTKYPEGYHLTLKDGDFETTISSQSTVAKAEPEQLSLFELFDYLFKNF